MKFWLPSAMKFTFLFLILAKIHIFFLNVPRGGEGSTGLKNIPKKTIFLVLPLQKMRLSFLFMLHCTIASVSLMEKILERVLIWCCSGWLLQALIG